MGHDEGGLFAAKCSVHWLCDAVPLPNHPRGFSQVRQGRAPAAGPGYDPSAPGAIRRRRADAAAGEVCCVRACDTANGRGDEQQADEARQGIGSNEKPKMRCLTEQR